MRKNFLDTVGTAPKKAFASTLLVANAFVWGFYSFRFLNLVTAASNLSNALEFTVRGLNFFGIVVAAIFGVYLVYHIKKRVVFLKSWMLTGIVLSLVPTVLDVSGFVTSAVFFTLVGLYFGFGMPVAFAYFAASTQTNNRSRLGGIIFFASFFCVFLLGALGITDITLNAFLLAAWQSIGFIITTFVKPEEQEINPNDQVPYSKILHNRPFLLYLIPWIMFIIINFLALPLVEQVFPELFQYIELIGTVLACFLALFFGFFADRVGRKRLAVLGFAMLGFGYASLGLFSGNIWGWWFFAVADGIAWGVFSIVFVMSVWGDLAQEKSSEKYYAIGFLPFLFSFFMQLLAPYVSLNVPNLAVFSFASVFLFIAVLPLAYAPETLNLKDREFRSYVEKAMQAKLQHEPDVATAKQ
ncbi:MAG: MFS transporter [Candidatus Bathyarchaeia archaeon]|jgi:MFS family permease